MTDSKLSENGLLLLFFKKRGFAGSSNTAFFFALWRFWNYFSFPLFDKEKENTQVFLNYVLTGERESDFQMSIYIPRFRGAFNKQFRSLPVLHTLKNPWLVQHFITLLQGISNLFGGEKKTIFHICHGKAKDNPFTNERKSGLNCYIRKQIYLVHQLGSIVTRNETEPGKWNLKSFSTQQFK